MTWPRRGRAPTAYIGHGQRQLRKLHGVVVFFVGSGGTSSRRRRAPGADEQVT